MTEPTTPEDRPALPDLPPVRPVLAVPQDSAVEAETIAFDLLSSLTVYLDDLTPCVEADPPVMDRDTLVELDRIRRSVATTTDLIIGRQYSSAATRTAGVAARMAERVAGVALVAGVRAGVLSGRGPDEVFGRTASLVLAMGEPGDDVFAAALELAKARGDVSRSGLITALGAVDVDDPIERERREIAERMAAGGATVEAIASALSVNPDEVRELARRYGFDIPADVPAGPPPGVPAAEGVPAVLWHVENAATMARRISPAAVAEIPPSQAADWARELFDHAKYVLQLRAVLDARGRGR